MKAKKKLSKSDRREERAALAFLLPNLLGFIIFVLVPVVGGLVLSLTNYDGFSEIEFVGIDNFKRLFQDEYFYTSLGNNIYYTIVSVTFTLVIALDWRFYYNRN